MLFLLSKITYSHSFKNLTNYTLSSVSDTHILKTCLYTITVNRGLASKISSPAADTSNHTGLTYFQTTQHIPTSDGVILSLFLEATCHAVREFHNEISILLLSHLGSPSDL